jgi:hypothetical protein
MKIQNTFISGKIQKDLDGRFVQTNELIDAENAIVITSEDSNSGVLKNVTGNIKKTSLNASNGKTIGHGVLASKNKIYNFVSGSVYDYIVEIDSTTWNSVIVCQSSVGQLLNFNPNKRMTDVEIVIDPEGDGDLLFFCGNGYRLGCLNIKIAKTWAINGFSVDEISLMKPSPIFAPNINLTTSVDGVENNFIEDKFLCFAYRYKYVGGFYSAPGSWSKVAFQPRDFILDFQSNVNNGMLNISNAVDISFNVGPRDVISVDLLFRESDTQTIYVIEQFVKQEKGWADSSIQEYQFSKSKIYSVLGEDQFLRNFDNVPLEANSMALIGNRVAYGNFLEGQNILEQTDFEVSLVTDNSISDSKDANISNFVDVISRSNNTDFVEGIPGGGSNTVDQMNYANNEITIASAPSGSDFYDFNIEITPKAGYSTTPYNIFVKDGNTVLESWLLQTGTQVKIFGSGVGVNIKIFVTSADGLLYASKLTYDIGNLGTLASRYRYYGYNQLAYPNSTAYPSTLEGNTVIDTIAEFDLTGIQFTSGRQLRINFELKSSLVSDFLPSVTFFYNLTQNHTDLADFIANSSFKQQLEDIFSLSFKNSEISNAGTIVNYTDFELTVVGNSIFIKTPSVVYNVTEPSNAVENKTEFYLITESLLFFTTLNGFASRHSNRDNEVGMIYLDEKGRKSTVLVCGANSIHIPIDSSDLITSLSVKVNNPPPTWAKYYKFAIKQTKRDYDIIYGNVVYTDGIFRWIKLIGGDKGKVLEGDLLTVKRDYAGALESLQKVKVLEVVEKQANFISDNFISANNELKEEAGLYFKIKQGAFDINITTADFLTFKGTAKRRYASESFTLTNPIFGEENLGVYTPYDVKGGSRVRFFLQFKAFGAISFTNTFEKNLIAQEDYLSVQDWFNAEIAILGDWIQYASENLTSFGFTADGKQFQVKVNRDGTQVRDILTDIEFDINFSGGTLVFETEPIEQLTSSFFETPETFTITNGNHEFVNHVLNDAFNCFSFGNGVESYKIRDSITGKSFSVDSNPNGVNKEGYRQIRRFADITYSEVYNFGTNINRLNEFNLSLANYKDDIEKAYGPIYKMRGKDTNLEVCQEDRDSIVFYGKDILYNADGSTNLSRIKEVLGQQKVYSGEYGISTHPDSYDFYENTSFHTDLKRGVVVKLGGNGMFEISSLGMRTYFKKLFRDNTITQIIGRYDQFYDYYLLNIKYIDCDNDPQYVTWAFSDKINGWLTRLTFNPEDMCRINSQFVSFKKGEVWLHNSDAIYNTFYGKETQSSFKFNYSQEPSTRKIYKALSIEGTIPLQTDCFTDLEKGYVNRSDFDKKENVYYGYIRGKNGELNTSQLSYQGVGNCSLNGFVLSFDFELDSIISVGDIVLNSSLQTIGTILLKSPNSLTLDTVVNISNGDFVLVSKPESIQKQGVLGYHLEVDCSFSSNSKEEIYSIGAEIVKSYM